MIHASTFHSGQDQGQKLRMTIPRIGQALKYVHIDIEAHPLTVSRSKSEVVFVAGFSDMLSQDLSPAILTCNLTERSEVAMLLYDGMGTHAKSRTVEL